VTPAWCACPERALPGLVPVLPKHHYDTVRVANGKVANPIGTRLEWNFDGDPPSEDLLVKRVHVPDPEEDANTHRRVLALGQMKCCVIPPHYSVLVRFGSRIGPELQYPPVEGGRSRNIRDQEHRSGLVELLSGLLVGTSGIARLRGPRNWWGACSAAGKAEPRAETNRTTRLTYPSACRR
jgi:hypothetical protein